MLGWDTVFATKAVNGNQENFHMENCEKKKKKKGKSKLKKNCTKVPTSQGETLCTFLSCVDSS